MSVTHVCHSWRTLALSIPSVWSRVEFFSDVHASYCTCDACEARDDESYYRTASRTTRPAPTNLRAIPDVLSRGLQTPITLDVTSLDSQADGEMIMITFGKLLVTHKSRLTTIRISLAQELGLCDFFETFDSLPALRSLKLTYTGDEDEVSGPVSVLNEHISMPCLSRLELGPFIKFPRRDHLHLPALTHLTASFSSAPELREILDACPTLQHLEVIPFANATNLDVSTEALQEVAPLVKRLREIRLLNIRRDTLAPSLDIFAHPVVADLQINCAEMDADLLSRALEILAHVSAPVQFGFSTSGNLLVLTTANDAGHRRVLGMTIGSVDKILQRIWAVVPPPSLWFFCTTWTLWLRVCGDIGRATQLQHIVIVLPHGNAQPLPAPDVPGAHFPKLMTLALHSAPHPTDKARVPLSWIRGVVRSLALGKPLERLYLVNVQFTLDKDDALSDDERFDLSFAQSIKDMTGMPGFGGFLGP
ncbi:hypothetical protein AURDEDRAFT_188859 [Auricularia subglabra TFB-10046 SS5]|uniref:F-box domain-containing protein n=1 Tax=Auricularia subglabra (strain TFB-10046 / SS5) TaxID=717982 RepID=J0LE07_AURST|nr:hypothetical protein AURDEDRAFT_188859 [Auricularia subglabra TFB-10046 SS5]